MGRLLMITALFLVAGLVVLPAALAQEDDVTVQEGPPLTASPTATATPTGNLANDVINTTTTPTATSGCTTRPIGGGEFETICIDTAPPTATATVTPTPTATVAAKAQYDGGGKKEVVVGGGRTLPQTGGVSSIALLAGALLIGGGIMGLALFRRS